MKPETVVRRAFAARTIDACSAADSRSGIDRVRGFAVGGRPRFAMGGRGVTGRQCTSDDTMSQQVGGIRDWELFPVESGRRAGSLPAWKTRPGIASLCTLTI